MDDRDYKAMNEELNQTSCAGAAISRLSDEQIELVANIFSQGNQHLLADMEVEWLLGHAFQLGAKFHRDFTMDYNGFGIGVERIINLKYK